MNSHYHDYRTDAQQDHFIQAAESDVYQKGGSYIALQLAKLRALDDLFAFRREGFHSEHVQEVNHWAKDNGHHHYYGHHGEQKVIAECAQPKHDECHEPKKPYEMTPESHPHLFVDCADHKSETAHSKTCSGEASDSTEASATLNTGCAS